MEQSTAFFDAIIQGNLEDVKSHLKKGQDINATLPNGSTALILAAQHNKRSIG